jgi:hypothetical protein
VLRQVALHRTAFWRELSSTLRVQEFHNKSMREICNEISGLMREEEGRKGLAIVNAFWRESSSNLRVQEFHNKSMREICNEFSKLMREEEGRKGLAIVKCCEIVVGGESQEQLHAIQKLRRKRPHQTVQRSERLCDACKIRNILRQLL